MTPRPSFKPLLIFILLLSILLLSGCGRAVLTGDDLEALWQEEEEQAALQAAAAPPPVSLREAGLEPVRVFLHGREYAGVQLGGAAWCDCRDLAERFPDLQWQAEGGQLLLDDGAGHQLAVPGRVLSAGQQPSTEDGALLSLNADGTAAEAWISLDRLRELWFRCLYDESGGVWYISPSPDTSLIPAGCRVPVLMYHAVSDNCWGLEGLFMSPADMEDQLRFLKDNGYDTLFFSDLTHLEDYDKPVILTFDDGYRDNCSELLPLLEKYHAKATVFVVAANVDNNPNFVTSEQVRQMSDSGLVDVESHTVNHRELASLNAEQQMEEMRDSQIILSRYTGKVPYVISYPAGMYDGDTLAVGPDYYDFGVKSRGGLWTTGGSLFEISRFPIYRGADAATLESLLP